MKQEPGKIRIRGRVPIEKRKNGGQLLVITERFRSTVLGANIGKFLNDVAALIEAKKTTDIS